jgi:hypothetical protein
MKFLLAAATVAALFAACGTKRNEERCLEGLCSDPDLPFCDIDGTIGGEPNACIAVNCTPGEFASCRDDRALMCNGIGDNYDLVQCANGCDANGCKPCTTPECEKHIIPKYLPTICDQRLSGDPRSITTDATIDTTNPQNCSSVVMQPGGVDICVLRYSALTIEANRTLTVTGPRAVALVADDDLTIVGALDVSAIVNTNGPGGGVIVSGTCTGTKGGCGGAGYRTAGGSGGGTGATGNGGAKEPLPTQLAVLRGGTRCQGGSGAGGAATLISCRGTVNVPGLIDANGSGGYGDVNDVQHGYYQATGGNSGGTVVLQGMTINATGRFYANGGGGGAGGAGTGLNGEDGKRSAVAALGGVGGGAVGGNGGSEGSMPSNGSQYFMDTTNGGAGGGSAGYFLVYAPPGSQVIMSPAEASPVFLPVEPLATN